MSSAFDFFVSFISLIVPLIEILSIEFLLPAGAKTSGLTCCAVTPKDFAPGLFGVTKAPFPFCEPLTAYSPNRNAASVTKGWRTHHATTDPPVTCLSQIIPCEKNSKAVLLTLFN
jgi:hypothetical protein